MRNEDQSAYSETFGLSYGQGRVTLVWLWWMMNLWIARNHIWGWVGILVKSATDPVWWSIHNGCISRLTIENQAWYIKLYFTTIIYLAFIPWNPNDRCFGAWAKTTLWYDSIWLVWPCGDIFIIAFLRRGLESMAFTFLYAELSVIIVDRYATTKHTYIAISLRPQFVCPGVLKTNCDTRLHPAFLPDRMGWDYYTDESATIRH